VLAMIGKYQSRILILTRYEENTLRCLDCFEVAQLFDQMSVCSDGEFIFGITMAYLLILMAAFWALFHS